MRSQRETMRRRQACLRWNSQTAHQRLAACRRHGVSRQEAEDKAYAEADYYPREDSGELAFLVG